MICLCLGISVETLVSRLIKTGVGISQPGHAFDIPASSIRIRDSHDSVVTRQKLLESYNRGAVPLNNILLVDSFKLKRPVIVQCTFFLHSL